MALIGIDIDRPDAPVILVRDLIPQVEACYRHDGSLEIVACSHEVPDVEEYVQRTPEEYEYRSEKERETSSAQDDCKESEEYESTDHSDDGRDIERRIDGEAEIFEHSAEEVEQEMILDTVT